ncbi:hypothetical protein BS50DRAFT_331583 [Corynespora cassiicola Philippines]|uniref:Uncharacterized protein n=1 Tax=Corynespora cassiicola Philippines TaxID=1448308 RepID=A0A2T2NVE5_CORCC|nr:hypothetical protein BS50DRAFT_331583 [Corynespora cassiicola Philippines]
MLTSGPTWSQSIPGRTTPRVKTSLCGYSSDRQETNGRFSHNVATEQKGTKAAELAKRRSCLGSINFYWRHLITTCSACSRPEKLVQRVTESKTIWSTATNPQTALYPSVHAVIPRNHRCGAPHYANKRVGYINLPAPQCLTAVITMPAAASWRFPLPKYWWNVGGGTFLEQGKVPNVVCWPFP